MDVDEKTLLEEYIGQLEGGNLNDQDDYIGFATVWQSLYVNNKATNNIIYATKFIEAFINNDGWNIDLSLSYKLQWVLILVRIILTQPVYNKRHVNLTEQLFTNTTSWDAVFGTGFTADFKTHYWSSNVEGLNIFAAFAVVPLLNTYNKIVYEKQNDTYKKYKLIKTSLESKDILKISIEPIEEFIVLQPTVNINAYLKIVSGIFNEKT